MTLSFLTKSLKSKLYGLVFFAIAVILMLVWTGTYYYGNIRNANAVKDNYNALISRIQEARIAEKTYLQFFSEEQKKQFERLAAETAQDFEKQAGTGGSQEIIGLFSSARDFFGQYQRVFGDEAKTHNEQEQLKKDMMQPLSRALELLGIIQGDLETRQSELQMEGDDLNAVENEMLNITRDCKLAFMQMQGIQYQFLLSGDTGLMASFKEISDNIVNNISPALHETSISLQNKKFLELSEEIKGTVQTFLGLIEKSQALGVKERETIKKLDEMGKKAIEPAQKVVALANAIIDGETKSAVTAITSIVIAGMLAFLCLSFYLVRMITRPLHQVVAGLKDIAEGEGNLTNRLEVKSVDEMGELAQWFNIFIGKMQVVIRDVAQNAGRLQSSSSQLLDIAKSMSSGSDQTFAKANTVAAAGEEMSGNMNAMSSAMASASDNVSMVASAIEEMTATINQIAESTEQASKITLGAVSQTENASVQISELGESARDIGKVIETITDISEQVNLLALNATIEAARAGEAGKGFAVVANEIKELARQTSAATNEIKQRVQGIQNSTLGTVQEIAAITKVVNEVNHIVSNITAAVEEQLAATKEIATNINQASTVISDVNQNVAQGSVVSSQIAQEIAEVKDAAEVMSENSVQVNQSATDVSGLAEDLHLMVNRFKV